MAAKQTLEQQRAKHAWDMVTKAKGLADPKEFGRQAKALPTRIMTAGLGQALAFLGAKKKAPLLADALSDWVLRRMGGSSGGSAATDAAGIPLLNAIKDRDALFLRWATAEALAYLQWLTRFADAEGLTSDD